ncbi:MAG: translation elongation factor Ts [Planctomycetota bacterium]|jgi:elongation factor Ts|nr:translation elongation factor Ts [Planctomycetota bacterium]
MAIDAKLIKELREKTGMGIANCKKALEDANGDCERAEMILRKQGLDKAAKKADRPTGQGVIAVKVDGDKAAMIELACEQEPTTNNERFLTMVALALDTSLRENVQKLEDLLAAKSDDGTIADSVKALIGVVGENVQIRKAVTFTAPAGGLIGSYVHFNKKAGAIVALKLDGAGKDSESMRIAANDICLHAVAARPLAWRREDIPQNVLDKEKEVFMEEIKSKPEQIRGKILEGKLQKFYTDKVLPEQLFVKGLEGTVKEMLDATAKEAGGKAEIAAFARFELGL